MRMTNDHWHIDMPMVTGQFSYVIKICFRLWLYSRLFEVSALHERHCRQINVALQRLADLLIRERLHLLREVRLPVHCSAVMSLAGNAADKFAILCAADFLGLKPAGLCGGDFGIAEAVPH